MCYIYIYIYREMKAGGPQTTEQLGRESTGGERVVGGVRVGGCKIVVMSSGGGV